MTSFAWGIAPSTSRSQVQLGKLGGCNVSDAAWNASVKLEIERNLSTPTDSDPDVLSCYNLIDPELVPRLLIGDLMTSVARRILNIQTGAINSPRVKVHKSFTSSEYQPRFWLVTSTVCFPCDGTPVTRCLDLTALLDASHVDRSRVVSVRDAGVVPAEQASGDVVPFNVQSRELIISR